MHDNFIKRKIESNILIQFFSIPWFYTNNLLSTNPTFLLGLGLLLLYHDYQVLRERNAALLLRTDQRTHIQRYESGNTQGGYWGENSSQWC